MSRSDVVEALVAAGLVDPASAEEARQVVAAHAGPAQGRGGRAQLVEVAGYLGAALVAAAFGLFLADSWSDLGGTGQVLALGAIAVVLVAAGVAVVAIGHGVGRGFAAVRADEEPSRRRLASVLFTAGAVAAAFTVARVVELADESYSSWPALVGGLTLVVLAGVGYWAAHSVVGQAGIAAGLVTAAAVVGDVADTAGHESLLVGLLLLVAGAAWVCAAEVGVFAERLWARAIGSGLALLGAQLVVFTDGFEWLAYLLTLGVGVAGFVLYLAKLAWPYLVVGVAAVTLVVPEAIIDWTDGSLGVAGGVLVAGLALLGASGAGFRLRQEATEEPA